MAEAPNNRTELVFILDRSGSMGHLTQDTIGGYNSLIKKQQQEQGECYLTTVLFDHQYELLHDHIDIQEVQPITEKEYWTRGSTALLDAVGRTVQHISNTQNQLDAEKRADKVMIVITTDGQENASREYTYEQIQRMIHTQKTEFGWEFLFLGANIDAVHTAARFGIDSSRAANYHADREGTQLNYETLSRAVSHMRSYSQIDDSWKDAIDADYSSRSSGQPSRSSAPSPVVSSAPSDSSINQDALRQTTFEQHKLEHDLNHLKSQLPHAQQNYTQCQENFLRLRDRVHEVPVPPARIELANLKSQIASLELEQLRYKIQFIEMQLGIYEEIIYILQNPRPDNSKITQLRDALSTTQKRQAGHICSIQDSILHLQEKFTKLDAQLQTLSLDMQNNKPTSEPPRSEAVTADTESAPPKPQKYFFPHWLRWFKKR